MSIYDLIEPASVDQPLRAVDSMPSGFTKRLSTEFMDNYYASNFGSEGASTREAVRQLGVVEQVKKKYPDVMMNAMAGAGIKALTAGSPHGLAAGFVMGDYDAGIFEEKAAVDFLMNLKETKPEEYAQLVSLDDVKKKSDQITREAREEYERASTFTRLGGAASFGTSALALIGGEFADRKALALNVAATALPAGRGFLAGAAIGGVTEGALELTRQVEVYDYLNRVEGVEYSKREAALNVGFTLLGGTALGSIAGGLVGRAAAREAAMTAVLDAARKQNPLFKESAEYFDGVMANLADDPSFISRMSEDQLAELSRHSENIRAAAEIAGVKKISEVSAQGEGFSTPIGKMLGEALYTDKYVELGRAPTPEELDKLANDFVTTAHAAKAEKMAGGGDARTPADIAAGQRAIATSNTKLKTAETKLKAATESLADLEKIRAGSVDDVLQNSPIVKAAKEATEEVGSVTEIIRGAQREIDNITNSVSKLEAEVKVLRESRDEALKLAFGAERKAYVKKLYADDIDVALADIKQTKEMRNRIAQGVAKKEKELAKLTKDADAARTKARAEIDNARALGKDTIEGRKAYNAAKADVARATEAHLKAVDSNKRTIEKQTARDAADLGRSVKDSLAEGVIPTFVKSDIDELRKGLNAASKNFGKNTGEIKKLANILATTYKLPKRSALKGSAVDDLTAANYERYMKEDAGMSVLKELPETAKVADAEGNVINIKDFIDELEKSGDFEALQAAKACSI